MKLPEGPEVRELPDGSCEFEIRVTPGAPRSRVRGLHGKALKLAVNAPPERGKANEAAAELVADFLGVKANRVEVVAGHRSRVKRVRVSGVPAAKVVARMAALQH